ncbi:hypothetical protein OBBRIDRAFT_800146 [Obba rivulosa]|uniref:Uncharacterized protein n=1 Tax=Obba rivulosa TaxID=1052685 RepID=A0A8E2DUG4_9APHY|nr:hypothetical protein OBBRIDRAFT_800146 [Obba rivulosa]
MHPDTSARVSEWYRHSRADDHSQALPPPANDPRPSEPKTSSRRGALPPLDLAGCEPRIPASSISAGATTAFVFTSSRSRADLAHSQSPPSSPLSPRMPHKQPALTPAQLARHSSGAVDTRTTLGPNMRAAGFVHLPHACTPSAGPIVSPAASSAASTPSDPPPFPSMVFVSPSSVASMSAWEYQRMLAYDMSGQGEPVAGPSSRSEGGIMISGPKSNASAVARLSTAGSSGLLSPIELTASSSNSTLFSTSSVTLAASSSSDLLSTGLGPKAREKEDARAKDKAKAKARAWDPDAELAEYPFPITPPQRNTESRSYTSTPASISPFVLSRTISSMSNSDNGEGSSRSHTHSHSHSLAHSSQSSKNHWHLYESKPPSLSAASSSIPSLGQSKYDPTTTPRFATVRGPPAHAPPLSITELCASSSDAWSMDSVDLLPMSRSGGRAKDMAPARAPEGETEERERTRTAPAVVMRSSAASSMHGATTFARRGSEDGEDALPVPPPKLKVRTHKHGTAVAVAASHSLPVRYSHSTDWERGRDTYGKVLGASESEMARQKRAVRRAKEKTLGIEAIEETQEVVAILASSS